MINAFVSFMSRSSYFCHGEFVVAVLVTSLVLVGLIELLRSVWRRCRLARYNDVHFTSRGKEMMDI